MAEKFSFEPGVSGSPSSIVSYPQGGEITCPIISVPATGVNITVVRTGDSVKKALSDPRFSRAQAGQEYSFTGTSYMNPLGMLRLDPPEVRKIHTLLGPLFFSADIEKWRPGIEAIARRLADGFSRKTSPVDLTAEYIEPFLSETVSLTLGVSKEEWPRLKDYTDRTLALVETPDDAEKISRAWDELYAYTEGVIAEKQSSPDGSMISDTINILSSSGISGDALLYAVTTVLNAYPTPLPVMEVAAVELLQRPEIIRMCQDDPSLWKITIDELMRYKAHFAYVQPRIATEDVDLEGTIIHKGEVVFPSLTGAAHDPKSFPNPDDFNISTENARRNIVFGAGPHYCLGAEISRQWLQIGFSELFKAVPNLHLSIDASDLQWQKGVLSTPESIPVIS